MTNQVEQVASKARPEDDPYRLGYLEGVRFAEERAANLWKLEGSNSEMLHCVISRDSWRKANEVWQREQASPNTYMSPQSILEWLVVRIPEMKFFMTWAEGQGHVKGFLEGKGIKVKGGGL